MINKEKERKRRKEELEKKGKEKERKRKREEKEKKRAEMERRVNKKIESILEKHKFVTIEESMKREEDRKVTLRRENIIAKKDEEAVNIIHKHIKTLVRKRKQQVIKDDYGNIDDSKWKEEKEYFFDNVIKKNTYKVFDYKKTLELIDTLLDEFEGNNSSNYSESMSPYDYEYFCASLLKENGWISETTRGSGDQGVDVIATKNNYRIVLQCKKYSSPVGNKAVQEVFSAKSHIGADYAIVVTNHTYTKSAKELASTTGVILLHHDELKVLSF